LKTLSFYLFLNITSKHDPTQRAFIDFLSIN